MILCGLLSVLRGETDFNVVASCRDGRSCIDAMREMSPDLALLSMELSCPDGLEVLAAIRQEHLGTKVIYFSDAGDCDETARAATARGAYGVIPCDVDPSLLVKCLRAVASGQRLSQSLTSNPGTRKPCDVAAVGALAGMSFALTGREREIMRLVCEGLSNKEVGRQLMVREGTIKVHLHRIYQKLAVQNRTALAAVANDVKRDTIPSTHDQNLINDSEQAPRAQTSRQGALRSTAR